MPTTSLYETKDASMSNKAFHSVPDMSFVSNTAFAFAASKKSDLFDTFTLDMVSVDRTKKRWGTTTDGGVCVVTGGYAEEGVCGNAKQYVFSVIGSSFSDYNYLQGNDFISLETLWSIKARNMKALANTLITKKGVTYMYGTKAEEGKKLKDHLQKPRLLKPPFSLNIKDTMNSQHVVFKNKVSLSNAMIALQYGNKTYFVDGERLGEARKEYDKILAKHKFMKKSHLIGNFSDNYHAKFKKADEVLGEQIVEAFQKRYDKSVRVAGWLSF